MKKIIAIILCAVSLGSLFSACAKSEEKMIDEAGAENNFVDLTTLSSTLVYSEVYNMVTAPESYVGKKVMMRGNFAVYENPKLDKKYYACVIADATACCQQGIEFVLSDDDKLTYPDDYPGEGDEIVVIGDFNTYTEDGNEYCHLENAVLSAADKTGE